MKKKKNLRKRVYFGREVYIVHDPVGAKNSCRFCPFCMACISICDLPVHYHFELVESFEK